MSNHRTILSEYCAGFDDEERPACSIIHEKLTRAPDVIQAIEDHQRFLNPRFLATEIRQKHHLEDIDSSLREPARISSLIPPLNPNHFYLLSGLLLLLTPFCLWFAAYLDLQLSSLLSSELLGYLARLPILDPLVFLVVSYGISAFILFKLSCRKGFNRLRAALLGIFAPAIIVVASYVINAIVLKPGMDFARPESYAPGLEPIFTGLWRRVIGGGDSSPSGSVVRQVVLCLTALWLLNHPGTREMYSVWRLRCISWLNFILVILTMLVRVLVGAHKLFDVVAGVSAGIMVFWLLVIPLCGFLYATAAHLAQTFTTVWLIFSISIFFYSYDPALWGLVSLGIFVLLTILSRLLTKRWSRT